MVANWLSNIIFSHGTLSRPGGGWWVVGRVIRVFTVMTAVMVPDGDIITVMGNSFDHSHSQQSQQASSPQTLPPTLHPLPSPPPRRMWE